MSSPINKLCHALPLIINWGLWISQNKAIFQECFLCPEVVAINNINILSFYAHVKDTPLHPIHVVRDPQINKAISWDFFDDASQLNQARCGGGSIFTYWIHTIRNCLWVLDQELIILQKSSLKNLLGFPIDFFSSNHSILC